MPRVSTPAVDRSTLLRAREAAGLTQEQLAAAARCSVYSIAAYERGKRNPTLQALERIAAATEHDVDFFLNGAAA
jgi:transcriptional regulator with XRE-family HTH domain